MTIADFVKAHFDRGEPLILSNDGKVVVNNHGVFPLSIEVTTAYIKLTFEDGSALQRVWYQGLVWVVV